MVWPILISLSVTPGPYFFSAKTTPDPAVRETARTTDRRTIASIIASPIDHRRTLVCRRRVSGWQPLHRFAAVRKHRVSKLPLAVTGSALVRESSERFATRSSSKALTLTLAQHIVILAVGC